MKVICTDGTVFTCEGFELSEYGVALYGQNLAQEKERYDNEPEQTGYVPHDRLWYILPDGVEPKVPGPSMVQGQPSQQPPQNGQGVGTGEPPVGPSDIGQPPVGPQGTGQPPGNRR